MSTGRVALIGAALAVLVAAALAAAVALHMIPLERQGGSAVGAVALAFVLPDSDGVTAPRVLDVYSRSGAGWSVRSVSPTTSAQVPGTGGSTLADAYSFGGGDGLAAALGASAHDAVGAWVIVDAPAWAQLQGSAPVELDLPSDIEVFDGRRLYSFPKGKTGVAAGQLPELLQGAADLPASENAMVRAQVGDALAEALTKAGSSAVELLRSDLKADALGAWLRNIRLAHRTEGS